MKMMLRVFFVHFTLEDTNGSKYKRTKKHLDFPPDVTPEAAYAELEHKFGKSTNSDMWDHKLGCQIAPHQFIEINSYSLVDVDREKVRLEGWEAKERALDMDFKSCLQDSPDLKAKKMRKPNRRNRS